jgi:hypothetical protein
MTAAVPAGLVAAATAEVKKPNSPVRDKSFASEGDDDDYGDDDFEDYGDDDFEDDEPTPKKPPPPVAKKEEKKEAAPEPVKKGAFARRTSK